MRAAVSRDINHIAIEELDEPTPQSGEVKIKMVATGICGTDLSLFKGRLNVPRPIVLGHEGAGIVVEKGKGVTQVDIGDHVLCTIIAACGHCFQCVNNDRAMCENANMLTGKMLDGTTRLRRGDEEINVISYQGSFAEYAIVPEICTVKMSKDVPLHDVVGLACGISTGLGAALVREPVTMASNVLVIGAGGVGLSTMMGAKVQGANKIIAADVKVAKLVKALELGLATDCINSQEQPLPDTVLELTDGRGADFAFDAVGAPGTLEDAIASLRAGGSAVVIGHAQAKVETTIDTVHFLRHKKVTGTFGGSINPQKHIPAFADLHQKGDIDLKPLMDRSYQLDDIEQAFADLEAGNMIRGAIHFT